MAAQAQVGHTVHQVGNNTVPKADPPWNYQINSIDRDRWDHMINCLIKSMKKFRLKPNNYEKVKKVQLGPDENPAVFQGKLVEAFRKYTNMYPSCPKGQALLAMHFIAQSAPEIRRKIQKVTVGPQTSMSDLLQLTYLVFNNKDKALKAEHTKKNIQKAQMMAVPLSPETTQGEARLSRSFWPWWTTWSMGTQTKPVYPVWTKGRLEERL